MTRPDPAICLRDVDIGYGGAPVVRGVSLDVNAEEMHVLLGESGSGKTTILRAIAGFEAISAGTLALHGTVVDRARAPRDVAPPERRGVGVVFQDYALFPHLDVAGNIAFGMPRRGQKARPAVDALLDQVGLAGLGSRHVSELSGGQQQRVALARALAQKPRIVLLDEPFSNLNRELRAELRDRTTEVLRAENITAIFVTHDRDEAFCIADRISVIQDGRLLQTGTPAEIYDAPTSEAAARSVGDVNTLPAEVGEDGTSATCALGTIPLRRPHEPGATVTLLLRPAHIRVLDSAETGPSARVARVRYFGSVEEIQLVLPDDTRLTATAPPGQIQPGQDVALAVTGQAVCIDRANHRSSDQ